MAVAAGIPVDRERHERMVDRLLGHLRNDDEGRKQFSIDYLAADTDGTSKRYQLTFRLLSDRFHPSGGTVLRLSDQAINLYLNALDLDVEDAQAAAEAVVRSQSERGKFHEAANAARGAMMNTIRYEQKIGQVLRETRGDVSHVDWPEAIPNLLAEAMHHIQRRLKTEQGIISVGRERLEDLPGRDGQAVDAIREVVCLVEQCRERHTALHVQLMQARSVFLDEQARQSFRPTRNLRYPDLTSEVLLPILRASQRDATQLVARSVPTFFGAIPTSASSDERCHSSFLRPGATGQQFDHLAPTFRWQIVVHGTVLVCGADRQQPVSRQEGRDFARRGATFGGRSVTKDKNQ